jgi:hypothetical protein
MRQGSNARLGLTVHQFPLKRRGDLSRRGSQTAQARARSVDRPIRATKSKSRCRQVPPIRITRIQIMVGVFRTGQAVSFDRQFLLVDRSWRIEHLKSFQEFQCSVFPRVASVVGPSIPSAADISFRDKCNIAISNSKLSKASFCESTLVLIILRERIRFSNFVIG